MNTIQITNYLTKQFAMRLRCCWIALIVLSIYPLQAFAQDAHSHMPAQHQATADEKDKANALLKIVRDSTERFKDVSVAEAEGYALQFGCVSGDSSGAMGLHYVNGPRGQRHIGRHASADRDLRSYAKRAPAPDRR